MSLQDDLRTVNDELESKLPAGSRMRTFDILVTSNAIGECIASAHCSKCGALMGDIIDIGSTTSKSRAVESVWKEMEKWTKEHVALCTRARPFMVQK